MIHGLDITLTFKDSVNTLLFSCFIIGVMQSEAQDISSEREDGHGVRDARFDGPAEPFANAFLD
ncbi:MAG: hypothetical protein F4246_04890 [Rhodothermaceae bacterium]|nr:hypothetical protein [Rhodothermaceae bacterium]MXX57575.1 hypothetical protein [Rhodothermaceae bacterium]MYD20411.1 hypothetical protein [Rhodothermaceae bacterium]MYD56331.1 hypothetical protein [Rhodothermaceae bacterium]MYI43238.1 hypothetical protein [Rhodothermaceae bacterium]